MKDCYIALLGCGNVGSHVVKLLHDYTETLMHREDICIHIKKILVRHVQNYHFDFLDDSVFTSDFNDIVNDDSITLVAEMMGKEEPATQYMTQCLEKGKTVVTANKKAVALHWHDLLQTAQTHQTGFFMEPALGGAMPIFSLLNRTLQSHEITDIKAIINGTTNYILTCMTEENMSYQEALSSAQHLHYAEQDPSSDVDGEDAKYKLSILSSLAFHTKIPISAIQTEGITNITQEDIAFAQHFGYKIKPLALAQKQNNQLSLRVCPALLPFAHPLSSVSDNFNAVSLNGSSCGDMMLYGRGAGSAPTSSAIVNDITYAFTRKNKTPSAIKNGAAQMQDHLDFSLKQNCAFYVHLSVTNCQALAHVFSCFAQENVQIDALMKQKSESGAPSSLAFITHLANEENVQNAIKMLSPSLVTVHNTLCVYA